VLFVGTQRGIEARVLPEEGWPLELIEVVGIKGRGLSGLIRGVARLPAAWQRSRRIIRGFQPDVVVGVGGYASGPIVATAAMMGLPTAILEQNSVPGITNKILGKFVRRVFTAFPDERRFFAPQKVLRTGNPIRAGLNAPREPGDRRSESSRAAGPRLFVFGGSQGARAINRSIVESLVTLREAMPQLEIWHQTGASELESVQAGYAEAGFVGEHARVVPFIRDMAEPYAWCNLVLCRAGATSLAELASVGRPALLVPFPHAADDHQRSNARSLVDAGAAALLLESELSGERLGRELIALLADPTALETMSRSMRKHARPRAAAEIYEALVVL